MDKLTDLEISVHWQMDNESYEEVLASSPFTSTIMIKAINIGVSLKASKTMIGWNETKARKQHQPHRLRCKAKRCNPIGLCVVLEVKREFSQTESSPQLLY